MYTVLGMRDSQHIPGVFLGDASQCGWNCGMGAASRYIECVDSDTLCRSVVVWRGIYTSDSWTERTKSHCRFNDHEP